MVAVGITGTNASGKGTAVDILKEFGFKHYSVRDYLVKELEKEKREVNRANMRDIANEIRSEHGPGYIVAKLYEQASKKGENAVIESIRCVGEIEELEKHSDFILIGINARPKTRYERAVLRDSETDRVTFKEFINQEKEEMKSQSPGEQNIAECMKRADVVFTNNGSMEEFKKKISSYFEKHL
jgi:dephospho-CoA kinase